MLNFVLLNIRIKNMEEKPKNKQKKIIEKMVEINSINFVKGFITICSTTSVQT